jgi:hypothetical protein
VQIEDWNDDWRLAIELGIGDWRLNWDCQLAIKLGIVNGQLIGDCQLAIRDFRLKPPELWIANRQSPIVT